MTRRAERDRDRHDHPSDLDVFERYYEERPNDGGLEVFDE